MYADTTMGSSVSSVNRRCSAQSKNMPMSYAYASRVFSLRIVATKNSMNRRDARSPASVIMRGSRPKPSREICRCDIVGS